MLRFIHARNSYRSKENEKMLEDIERDKRRRLESGVRGYGRGKGVPPPPDAGQFKRKVRNKETT